MTVNAKESILLEFSNMMIYFSILLLCTLLMHFQTQQHRPLFLVLAAACFCLEVLSYPSVLILFPMLLVVLGCYSDTKGRDIMLFTGICILNGGIFLGFLVAQTSWNQFLECVQFIIMGDNTHPIGNFTDKIEVYLIDLRAVAALFAVCAFLSVLIVRLFYRKKVENQKACYISAFFVLLLLANFMQALLDVREDIQMWRAVYSAIYLPISLLAYRLRKYCGKAEKMAFQIGMVISIMGCTAVLLLTNLTFITTLSYFVLGIMVSMMPIGEYLRQNSQETRDIKIYGMLILFVCVFLFRNIYVIRSMSLPTNVKLLSISGIVKDGPMAGLVSDYMGPYIANSNLNDWRQNVRKGDRVLIVGTIHLSTIGYLYEDTEICVDSTICTPTYSEKLLSYWEMNPWKEPNVVVLDCWFGEPRIAENEWIMKWIEEHFDSYVDGRYVRFYRRE